MAKVRVTAETGCWYGEKFHKPGEKSAEFQMAPAPEGYPPYPDYVDVLEWDELDKGNDYAKKPVPKPQGVQEDDVDDEEAAAPKKKRTALRQAGVKRVPKPAPKAKR